MFEVVPIILTFKVAAKWEAWKNIVHVPENAPGGSDGEDEKAYARARRLHGAYIMTRFIVGTFISIVAAAIGWGIGKKVMIPLLENHKLDASDVIFQIIPIMLAVSGTWLLAFGLKIKRSIDRKMEKEAEIDKRDDLIAPSDCRQNTTIFWSGLGLLTVSGILQIVSIIVRP